MRNSFELMASYNTWMNAKVYEAAGQLSTDELSADKGAFFGSVLGTLNHLLVADRIWLQRFAAHMPADEALAPVRRLRRPQALNERLFADFAQMRENREMLDGVIEQWVGGLTDSSLGETFCYATLKGDRFCKRFASVLLHFFNHQTHHRGQVTTLLSQFGKDVGVTDLLVRVPNEQDTTSA